MFGSVKYCIRRKRWSSFSSGTFGPSKNRSPKTRTASRDRAFFPLHWIDMVPLHLGSIDIEGSRNSPFHGPGSRSRDRGVPPALYLYRDRGIHGYPLNPIDTPQFWYLRHLWRWDSKLGEERRERGKALGREGQWMHSRETDTDVSARAESNAGELLAVSSLSWGQ